MKIASVLVSVLMLVSLLMDWSHIYGEVNMALAVNFFPVIINNGFVTGVFSALAMLFMYLLLLKEADTFFIDGITNNVIRHIYLVGAIAIIFCSGLLEISEQFSKRLPGTGMHFVYLQLYTVAFFIALFAMLEKFGVRVDRNIRLVTPLLILSSMFSISPIYFLQKRRC